MINLDRAHKEVNDMYKQLTPMVDTVVEKNSKEVDAIFKKIKANLNNLTNKELQDYMLQLTVEAYYLTNVKDSSTLKQECALTLLKEGRFLQQHDALVHFVLLDLVVSL